VGVLRCRRVPPDEEDEDDEDYHVVKEEDDVAMEDAAPAPSVGDLPPEYHAIVAGGNDEEALLQLVLEASKADEYTRFEGYNDVIALTGMVAEHMASLPPPPPLPPHVRPVADYEGQDVPPPGVSCRQCRHDHL
jgi:hypothetical protein